MNIIEQYIVEVHNVEPYEAEWTKKHDKKFVKLDITTTCYGTHKRNSEHIMSEEEWEHTKLTGYFMA